VYVVTRCVDVTAVFHIEEVRFEPLMLVGVVGQQVSPKRQYRVQNLWCHMSVDQRSEFRQSEMVMCDARNA
jgi:hypothetical protein